MSKQNIVALLILFSGLMELKAQYVFTPITNISSASQSGNIRPRILQSNGNRACLWSKSGDGAYFSYQLQSGEFSTPELISSSNHSVFVSDYGGADLAMVGNDIFLVYMTTPYLEAQLFLRHSSNGGESWEDIVQIALPDSIIPFLPTIDVSSSGQPHVMFMGYDSNYSNPQYFLLRSSDGGASFDSPINLSQNAPHEVCDCCPGHLLELDGQAHAYFRNNDNNLREMWYARSTGQTAAADTTFDIDPSDWFLNGCPSQGPDAVASDDSIIAVWMTAGSGTPQIIMNKLDPQTSSNESVYLTNTDMSKSAPRIAGNGDTIGIAFEQIESPVSACVIMYSLDGGTTFSDPIDIVQDSAGLYKTPDIAFSEGGFDLVFRDIFGQQLSYRRFEFGFPVGIKKAQHSVDIYPNPTSDQLRFQSESRKTFEVLDIQGKEVLNGNSTADGVISVSSLNPGIYILVLESNRIRFVKF